MKKAFGLALVFVTTLAGAQWATQGLLVKDEGSVQGYAQAVNCTGSGVACSTDGFTATINATSGGGAGLPADPAACTAGQYVTDQDASGVLTCNQVAYSQVSGTPTIYNQTVQDEGVARTQRPAVNFTGAGVSCVDNAGSVRTDCTVAGGLTADPTACTSGQYVTDQNASGALTCAQVAYSQLSGTPTLYNQTVQDEGVALTQRPSLNFTGTGVSCVDNAGSTRTDCTISSGGGSPGSPTSSVQYNNAGAFGGISQMTSDGSYLIAVGQTAEPAAPAASSLKLWSAQLHGTSGPVLPVWKDGVSAMDVNPFNRVLSGEPVWGCIQPATWGSTAYSTTGSMAAGSATGTAAAVAWASTDARTRARWIQHPAAATANTSAGYRANLDYMWRGNAAGLGGFYWWGSVSFSTVNTTMRAFIGLKDATAVLTATSDPNAALDTVYFGCNAADSNLSICSNDNAGTATCTTLGANFPCHTTGASYDVALWAAPNAASIGYYIRHITTGNAAQGTVSSDLPRNTVALGWDIWVNTGSTASALNLHVGGTCYIANP